MRVLLAAILAFQSATAQSEADKLEAALKKFGERRYQVTEGGKATGTMTLKTRLDMEGDRKVVILEDQLVRKVGGTESTLTITETSALDGLGLMRAELAAVIPGRTIEATASVRGGDAYIKNDDGLLMLRDVKDELGVLTATRLLCAKPQEVGASFKARILLWTAPSPDRTHEFRCVARESIEVGGTKVDAFKWEQKWKGDLIKGGESSIENAYWLGADGALLRFRTGATEMILLPAAPAQSDADKLEAALKKFGDRKYRILQDGKESGNIIMKTRIEAEGDRKVVVMDDRFFFYRPPEVQGMLRTERADLKGLGLLSATVKHSDKDSRFSASVKDRKVILTVEGRDQTIEAPEGIVGESALLRLVCSAEQKKGAAFKVDVLSLTSEGLEPGHAFRCLGTETVEIGGKKVDAFKWESKREWKSVKKVGDEDIVISMSAENLYWVSPDGYLLRSTGAGASEFVLDAK